MNDENNSSYSGVDIITESGSDIELPEMDIPFESYTESNNETNTGNPDSAEDENQQNAANPSDEPTEQSSQSQSPAESTPATEPAPEPDNQNISIDDNGDIQLPEVP